MKYSFQLSQEDPNYHAYIEGAPDDMLQETNGAVRYYRLQAEKLKNEEKVTMFIDFSHLLQFPHFDDKNGFNFVAAIVKEYNRYESFLRKAVSQFMSDLGHQYAKEKHFQIGYYNMPAINKIRDLKVVTMGRLMSIHGTVTRTTEVKPELTLANFKCQECSDLVIGVEQQFKFTEPNRCTNDKCMNRTKWELQNSDSVFIDWQKLRV